MPHDVITQLLRVLAIETKQEKAIINAEPADVVLSGLEAFSFDYIVKWPLSLIINRFLLAQFLICITFSYCCLFIHNKIQVLLNILWEMHLIYLPSEHFYSPAVMLITQFLLHRKALTRYQMLFRHMFYCKHVERLLCNVWISDKDFKQYSLRSPKWWVCVKFTSVNLRKSGYTFSYSSNCYVQVCCCICPQTAHAELCAEHPVLHDVWGHGAQLAHYGEQPEDGELVIQEMHKFQVKCDPFWPDSSSAGVKHWWRSLPPHQLPGQLPEGLHVDQPGASQNLLQTDGCLHHVHKLHAGANVLGEKKIRIATELLLHSYLNFLHEDACFLYLEVHSKHEVRASFSWTRKYGWSPNSEWTWGGVREEEDDHKGKSGVCSCSDVCTIRAGQYANTVVLEVSLWKLCSLLQFLSEHMDTIQSDASLEATIGKFDSNFSMLLLDLLDKLSIYSTNDCEHSMISIIYRWNTATH